jgi:hypothetical protein
VTPDAAVTLCVQELMEVSEPVCHVAAQWFSTLCHVMMIMMEVRTQ